MEALQEAAESTLGAAWGGRVPRLEAIGAQLRNADLAIVAATNQEQIAITVEAKADESFDQPVSKVLAKVIARISADEPSNGVARIQDPVLLC